MGLFFAMPGEIRNTIYAELAIPPWGYVDIARYQHTTHPFAQLHPLIATEFEAFEKHHRLETALFIWDNNFQHTTTLSDGQIFRGIDLAP